MTLTPEVTLYACCIEWSEDLIIDPAVFIAQTEDEVYAETRRRIEEMHGSIADGVLRGDHAEGHEYVKGEGAAVTDNKAWYEQYHEITGMSWLTYEPVTLKIIH